MKKIEIKTDKKEPTIYGSREVLEVDIKDDDTGEIITGLWTPKQDLAVLMTESYEDLEREEELHQKQLETKKKLIYRAIGRRNRKEDFTQFLPKFEKEIVGQFPAPILDALMRLIPNVEFKGSTLHGEKKPLLIDGKKATILNLSKKWGVTRNTGTVFVEKFIKSGILEKKKFKGKEHLFLTDQHFLKGQKKKKDFSKKIIERRMNDIIQKCDIEVTKVLENERIERAKVQKEPRFTKLYPLALLGVLLSKTHYSTFTILHNHKDAELVKKGESVVKIVGKKERLEAFDFVTKVEMWNMYRGQKVKKLSAPKVAELEACLQILNDLGAFLFVGANRNRMIFMNPKLIYISLTPTDPDWAENISAMLNMTKNLDPIIWRDDLEVLDFED